MGFTTSQWISSIVLVASIIFYFAARTGQQQNAFLYVFGVALVVLIVGKFIHNFRYALHEPKRLWIRTPLWKLAKKKRCIKLSLIFYHSFIINSFNSYKSSKTSYQCLIYSKAFRQNVILNGLIIQLLKFI